MVFSPAGKSASLLVPQPDRMTTDTNITRHRHLFVCFIVFLCSVEPTLCRCTARQRKVILHPTPFFGIVNVQLAGNMDGHFCSRWDIHRIKRLGITLFDPLGDFFETAPSACPMTACPALPVSAEVIPPLSVVLLVY